MNRPLWVALSWLYVASPEPAQAQSPEPPSAHRLYVHRVLFAGSTRASGLGGAWVGVAEGASYGVNLASLAQPSPWEDDGWGLDFTLEGGTTRYGEDLDNDGRSDGASTTQGLLGTSLRVGRVGVGLHARIWNELHCSQPPCDVLEGAIQLRSGEIALSTALALFDGQAVIASGLFASSAVIETSTGVQRYLGTGVGIDALYRPRKQRYRVGAVWRSQQWVSIGTAEGTALVGRPVPSAAIVPPLLSVGIAAKLDEGGDRFNLQEPRGDNPTAPVDPTAILRDVFRSRIENPRGRWLVSAQLDTTFAVSNAVQLSHFIHGARPISVGERPLFTPRVGVEHITLPGRLRLRAGTYVEPSAFEGGKTRLHGTVGFDLFLFHVLFDWGLTGAADLAPRLTQTSLSFGIWH